MIWNQHAISEWAVHTFGPAEAIEDIFDKTADEFDELEAEIYGPSTDDGYIDTSKVAKELADVYIMIAQMATHIGVNLQSEVDKKMEINVSRQWDVRGNGTGQHR